jgi:hypothetical protein
LLVTLKAPTEGFQDAEIQWRSMLQTVHTVNGQLPQVESPNRPILPDELKPVSTKPQKVTVYREEVQKPVLAPQSMPYRVGGQDCLLYVPASWKVSGTFDNLSLTHPELPGTINVSLNSTLDSDPADKALSKAGRASLDFFSAVNRRDDEAVKNSALASVSLVTRVGVASGAAYRALDAVGVTGDNYWLLKYRIQGDWNPVQKLRFYDLISKMSLERVK